MLSREADACYWIGRYVERAEATARMVDVHYHARLESGQRVLRWSSLLAVADGAEDYARRYGAENDRDALHFFAFDPANPDSILSTWTNARENARSIRDQISSEMWESINIAYLEIQSWTLDRLLAESPGSFFGAVKNASHLFQGILNRTLIMGEPRDWLDAGRFLERADQTIRLLDVKYHDLLPLAPAVQSQTLGSGLRQVQTLFPSSPDPFGVGGPLDTHGWIATLRSVSAFEMYRKTHPRGISPADVVDFLIFDRRFPASTRHGIERVAGCLRRIRDGATDLRYDAPERESEGLAADLAQARGSDAIATGLHEFLQTIQGRIAVLGETITRTYLAY